MGNILWNALIHAVTLQWTQLNQDLEAFKDWFQSLWDLILEKVNAVRSWAEGKVSWLQGYAFGLFYQLGMDAARWVANLRTDLTSWINSIITWVTATRDWLWNEAVRLMNEAIAWARAKADAVRVWAEGYTNAVRDWLYNTFVWIQGFRDLIANWLVAAKVVIDWLWHSAWNQLKAFLSNPIGYVLGWLLPPLQDFINWWALWGGAVRDFVTQDLPRLRNLLARGFAFLFNLVDHPQDVILGTITPIFLDWLGDRIRERL